MSCNRCYDIHEAQKLGKTQESCKCHCHDNTYTTPNITWTNHTTTAGTIDGTTTTFRDYNATTANKPSFFYNAYTPKCDCDTQPCETYHETVNIKKVKPQEVPVGNDIEKNYYCPEIENHECICGGVVQGQLTHSEECYNNYKDKQNYTSCLCSMREHCSTCSPEW